MASCHGNECSRKRVALQAPEIAGATSPYTCSCQSIDTNGAKLSGWPAGDGSSLIHGRRSPLRIFPATPALKLLRRYSIAVCDTVRNMNRGVTFIEKSTG